MLKGAVRTPLHDENSEKGLDLQMNTKLWQDSTRIIPLGQLGSRYNFNEHNWISAQVGGAANWFEDHKAAGALTLESEFNLFHPQLYLNVELNAMLGEWEKEFWGWQALKYKYFNFHTGIHSEQIGKRTLLFGGSAGYYSEHREVGFELQYLDGLMEDVRGRTFRVLFSIDLSLAKPPPSRRLTDTLDPTNKKPAVIAGFLFSSLLA